MTPTPEHEDRCYICQKLKGQPPDRCPGHYQGTASDPMLSMTPTPEERGILECRKIDLCVLMHETYEAAAKEAGWKTQESCRVDFKDLPQANKLVMLRTAEAVLEYFREVEAAKDAEIARLHMERNAATLIANAAYEAVREQLAGAQVALKELLPIGHLVECSVCGHSLILHTGSHGCEYETGDRWVDKGNGDRLVAQGPCGCCGVSQSENMEPEIRRLRTAKQALAGGTAALDRHDAEKFKEIARVVLLEVLSHEERTGPRDHNEMVVSSEAIRAIEAAIDEVGDVA